MYDDFRKKLGIIQEACQGLRKSTSFRELLDVFVFPMKANVDYFDGGELYE
jgi:hypothetical protein